MNDSPQQTPSQSVRQIGPNVTKVAIWLIAGMTVTVSNGMWVLALHADAMPALTTALTPVVEWGREMASNAFYMALGAGGGGVGGMALGRKKATAST